MTAPVRPYSPDNPFASEAKAYSPDNPFAAEAKGERPSWLGTQARATAAGASRMALRTLSRVAGGLDAVVPERLRSGMAPEFERMAESVSNRLAPQDPQRRAEFESGAAGAELASELVKFGGIGSAAARTLPRLLVPGASVPMAVGAVEDAGTPAEQSLPALLATGARAAGADATAARLDRAAQTAGGRAVTGAAVGLVPDALVRALPRRIRVPNVEQPREPLALPPGQYEMGPATTRLEPETRPERMLPESGVTTPRASQAYTAPAGPGIPALSPEVTARLEAEARAAALGLDEAGLAARAATPEDITAYRAAREAGEMMPPPREADRRARFDAIEEARAIRAVDADGTARATARRADGSLPPNLQNASDEALLNDLADVYDAMGRDGVAPTALENEYGEVWTGIKDYKAVGRNASRSVAAKRIEAELQRRGLDVNEALGRMAAGGSATGDTDFPFGLNARPGAANPEVITTAGGAAAGGAAGAAADEENRARGAVGGAAAGAALGAGAPRFVRDITSLPPRTTPLSDAEVAMRDQLARQDEMIGRARGLLDRVRNQPGVANPEVLGTLAGAGAGGAVGAATDPADPVGSGVAGAFIGAGLTAGGAGALKRLRRPQGARPGVEPGKVSRLVTPERPRAEPSRPAGEPVDPSRAREYFNVPRVTEGLPPEIAARFERKVAEVAPTAQGNPKRRVTWDQTRAEAARILNANPAALDDIDWKRMSGAEGLALASVVRENTERVAELLASRARAVGPALREVDEQIAALDGETTALLRTLMKGTSQQGRELNAAKILANLDRNPTAWLMRAQRIKGPDLPLSAEEMAKVNDLLQRGRTLELAQYLASLQTATVPEKIAALRKAGLLTGIKGRVLDLIGTGLNGVLDAVDRGPAVLLDTLAAKAMQREWGQRTGERLPMAKFRSVAALGGVEAQQYGRGLIKGMDEAWTAIGGKAATQGGGSFADRLARWSDAIRSADFDEKTLRRLDIPRVVNFENPVVDTYAKLAMRASGLPDKVWGRAYFDAALAEQAVLQAGREGARDIPARAKQLLAAPTDEMLADATLAADELTFRNAGRLATFAQGLKKLPGRIAAQTPGVRPETARALKGYADAAMDWVFAFTRTPSNIAGRVGDYVLAPVSVARAGVKLREAMALAALEGAGSAASRRQQREAVKLLARATTGAGVMALGAYLAKEGLMTGAWPTETTEREAWRAQGKQANSVLFNGEWVPIGRLAPGGTAMAVGATLAQAAAKSGGAPNVGQVAAATGRAVLDQPMVTGVQALLDAVQDPEGRAGQWATREAGSIVPTIVADVQRARAGGEVKQPRNVLEGVAARIAPTKVPSRLDVFGSPVSGAQGVVNPLRGSPDRTRNDAVRGEMQRLGVAFGQPSRRKGETEEQLRARREREGQFVYAVVQEMVASPEYQALDDEGKRDAWAQAVRWARRQED